MPSDFPHGHQEPSARSVHVSVDILIAALWIAICTAAPEFIWRGAFVIIDHAQWGDLVAAALIGLILAFFIEPAVDRLRHPKQHRGEKSERNDRSYRLLFPTLAAFAFALSSVAIHDAIRAFVSDPDTAQVQNHFGFDVGLLAAIHIADAWSFVPFCISLAWLTAGLPYVRKFLAVLAVASPGLATWWFSWPADVLLTTWLPALAILLMGYLQWKKGPISTFHRRCAVGVAVIAIVWLTAAVLLDWVMGRLGVNWVKLYDWPDVGVDARFYLGWVIGLLLSPVPLVETMKRSRCA